jgi:hypothetical protein
MSETGGDGVKARQALMEQARSADAEFAEQVRQHMTGMDQAKRAAEHEQAKRAAEFAEQVSEHMTPEQIAGYVEQLKKLQRVPLTAAEWRQACEKWMYSTCIPGRLLPQLIMGPKGAAHPDWVPLERRLIMA